MDTHGSRLSVRLRGSQSRPLSQDSVWGKSVDESSPDQDRTTPQKVQRVGDPSVPTRGPDEARTPLTTTASSRPTVVGNSPTFPDTPTPPAKARHLKAVETAVLLQQQQLDIAAIAMKLDESRRKLHDRAERSDSSQASKANSRRAARAGAPSGSASSRPGAALT